MIPSGMPEWWRDVAGARDAALADCEGLLDLLERELSSEHDRSADAVAAEADRWRALLNAHGEALRRLRSGMRLVEARRADAAASGFAVPVETAPTRRLGAAAEKSRRLAGEIRSRLAALSGELASRQPRKPVYRPHSATVPSALDIRV